MMNGWMNVKTEMRNVRNATRNVKLRYEMNVKLRKKRTLKLGYTRKPGNQLKNEFKFILRSMIIMPSFP
jgi:hypothetical protein